MLDYGFYAQMRALFPIIVRSLLMGVAVFVITLYVTDVLAKLLIGILVGSLVYAILCYLMKDKTYMDIMQLVQKRLSR